jgi:hypothetical protein
MRIFLSRHQLRYYESQLKYHNYVLCTVGMNMTVASFIKVFILRVPGFRNYYAYLLYVTINGSGDNF